MVARRKKVAREDSPWELDGSPWEENLPWDGNQWVDTGKLPWEGECYIFVMFFFRFFIVSCCSSFSFRLVLSPLSSSSLLSFSCCSCCSCCSLSLSLSLFSFYPTSPTRQTIHVWHCPRRASNSRS